MIAYYHWIHLSSRAESFQVAYVLSPSLDLFDSPAEVHSVISILKNGQKVQILNETGDWTKVRLDDGNQGWLPTKELIDSKTYEDGQKLLSQLTGQQAQASGHAAGPVNLHLEPAREAPVLGMLMQGENLQVFNRRLLEKASPGSSETPVLPPSPHEAWYLVRAGSRAGWVLGRLITLDIPSAISQYAGNFNLVAWLTLNTVDDNGQKVPQYLVADRVGSEGFDFTHIRVFTWWAKRHQYVTAYVESRLKGEFPIRTQDINGVPYFRLRLLDDKGRKFQKVYGLFGTIVRPLGAVEGWENDSIPQRVHYGKRRR